MAALDDIPWIDSMAPSTSTQDHADSQPPTVAAFSPTTISGSSLASRQRSSIIVHRKSPLLVATPPPITRALAYSHPFILPLNKLVGLLTWTTDDAWQSFLLVSTFWAVVLYGDAIILWAGPPLVVIALILGMYWRRYSPLSTRSISGEKPGHQRAASDNSMRHHDSLDEIVESMRTFTTRCNILLEPFLELTDFLSTQRSATSATTRPALTTLFVRILLVTPIWIALTLPPVCLITTRRVILIIGTIILTYHSRPARISRVILWRSLTIRRICSMITGLTFSLNVDKTLSARTQSHGHAASIATRRREESSGVRFTFILYENQRRWLGIGWTVSLFPSERAAWTDEHLNHVPSKDEFELPEVQSGNAKWRWVAGSEWHIDGADDKSDAKASDGGGWIYYDNKWNDGRRGQDGWDRYTRRRKWCRDAELVEVNPNGEPTSEATSGLTQALERERRKSNGTHDASTVDADSESLAGSTSSKTRRRRWFGGSKTVSDKATGISSTLPASNNNSSVDLGRITPSTASSSRPAKGVSRPISIPSSQKLSSSYDSPSGSGSYGREGSLHGSTAHSDLSIRDKEIANSQDRLDRWGARAAGGTERAEREMGLGDEVNMGLS
ncbi:integral peroxisomal membrane peroxin-domain-containing protein [Aspergillus avenaceus]|uniref:Integral peroxisomal membrane peroxin-domain-containing protein n=1 Tax=Aspergillus avenaceus TaxID=36643 RepID=A0A5N6U1Z1_ASPAV|nr:integral peroxisomal membrane peroxin-domain-containing protein [Aspergillus avenaceus]